MTFQHVLTFVGICLPTLFANVALAVTYRKIMHPALYFVLAVITFNWLSNVTYDCLVARLFQPSSFVTPRHASSDFLILFAANAISALLGSIILWRLALAMKRD